MDRDLTLRFHSTLRRGMENLDRAHKFGLHSVRYRHHMAFLTNALTKAMLAVKESMDLLNEMIAPLEEDPAEEAISGTAVKVRPHKRSKPKKGGASSSADDDPDEGRELGPAANDSDLPPPGSQQIQYGHGSQSRGLGER